jgi:hypothetical protein
VPIEISGLTSDEARMARIAVEVDGRTVSSIEREALLENCHVFGRVAAMVG